MPNNGFNQKPLATRFWLTLAFGGEGGVVRSQDVTEWLSMMQDTEVVDYVCIEGCDNFHILGRFRAGPAFTQYKGLLTETYRLREMGVDNWIDALEVVNKLGLWLVRLSGRLQSIRDFQLETLYDICSVPGVRVQIKFIGAEPVV